jgi:hypothetical protein
VCPHSVFLLLDSNRAAPPIAARPQRVGLNTYSGYGTGCRQTGWVTQQYVIIARALALPGLAHILQNLLNFTPLAL